MNIHSKLQNITILSAIKLYKDEDIARQFFEEVGLCSKPSDPSPKCKSAQLKPFKEKGLTLDWKWRCEKKVKKDP